jgi:hypothetical protein
MLGPFSLRTTYPMSHPGELNVKRRQLTDGQQVLLGLAIEPSIHAEALRRQEELGRTHGKGPFVTDVTKGRTTAEALRRMLAGTLVADATRVGKDANERKTECGFPECRSCG